MIKNKPYISVKDHSVSGESFQLLYNEDLDLLETHPQPQQEDLGRYYESEDYISHTDTKRNLFEKAYHFIRSVSLKRKLKLIDSFSFKTKTLLDIGCGTGDFLQISKKHGWTVFGIEPNTQARNIANNKVEDSVYEIEKLQVIEKQSFDVITLWHVLEHLPNLDEQIKILKSLLKQSGRLIIAVPNFNSFDANHYKEFWAAYDVPRHFWHFSQASISNLFLKENMIVENTLPMSFDAYYVSLLSEKYKSGWMNIFKAFIIGAQSNFKARSSGEYSSLIYVLKNQ